MTGYRRSNPAYPGGSHTTRSRRLPSYMLSTSGSVTSEPLARRARIRGHWARRRCVMRIPRQRTWDVKRLMRVQCSSRRYDTAWVRLSMTSGRGGIYTSTARRRCGRNSARGGARREGLPRSAPPHRAHGRGEVLRVVEGTGRSGRRVAGLQTLGAPIQGEPGLDTSWPAMRTRQSLLGCDGGARPLIRATAGTRLQACDAESHAPHAPPRPIQYRDRDK